MRGSAQAHNIWAAHLSKHTDICTHICSSPPSQGPWLKGVCARLPLRVHFWELEDPAEDATNT